MHRQVSGASSHASLSPRPAERADTHDSAGHPRGRRSQRAVGPTTRRLGTGSAPVNVARSSAQAGRTAGPLLPLGNPANLFDELPRTRVDTFEG